MADCRKQMSGQLLLKRHLEENWRRMLIWFNRFCEERPWLNEGGRYTRGLQIILKWTNCHGVQTCGTSATWLDKPGGVLLAQSLQIHPSKLHFFIFGFCFLSWSGNGVPGLWAANMTKRLHSSIAERGFASDNSRRKIDVWLFGDQRIRWALIPT